MSHPRSPAWADIYEHYQVFKDSQVTPPPFIAIALSAPISTTTVLMPVDQVAAAAHTKRANELRAGQGSQDQTITTTVPERQPSQVIHKATRMEPQASAAGMNFSVIPFLKLMRCTTVGKKRARESIGSDGATVTVPSHPTTTEGSSVRRTPIVPSTWI